MTWYIKCLELLFGRSSVSRRYLIRKWHQNIVVSPAPAPGPAAESPTDSPAPSSFVPASSPSPILQPPAEAPEPSLPQDLNDSPLPPSVVKHPPPIPHRPDGGLPHPQENNSGRRKYTIAAIAGTAATTCAFFTLLLFCCVKRRSNKMGPRNGSLQKYHNIRNSRNNDLKTGSFINNMTGESDSWGSSQNEAHSSEATAGSSGNTLPPGRAAPPPPVPPPPPPPPRPKPPAPRPPPPPKVVRPPPPPKSGSLTKPSPLGPHHRGHSSSSEGNDLTGEFDAPKTKLKPLFWDKVPANPDSSMVWHEIRSGSFQFNEERIETLFGYADKSKNDRRKDSSFEPSTQYIQIIDAKKSQNLAILLRALNVTTEEVCDALKEGNELPTGLVQTLLKMAPTTEEELKLRLFSGDLSQLGPAERFLKVMVGIPFAFKRLESLFFMSSFQEDIPSIKESFQILEVACKELRNSRLFLKLLEAVLKTGNRMNDGTFRGGAQAFKLDTLLKLSDVKGTDGKTTLLHFVVQEIIRSEGIRAARRARESQSMSSMKTGDLVEDSSHETEDYYRSLGLQVVSGLSNDLENVRKAALVDGDSLMATVSKLGHSLLITREFLNNEMKSIEEESQFHDKLASFVEHAENDITWLLEEEKRIMALVKSTVDYFHRNAGKDEGLRLFVIVRDILIMVDKACKEVKNSAAKPMMTHKKEASTVPPSQESRQPPSPDVRQRLFPAIRDQQMDDSSSDDESSSP
uniref:Formin-like protein n=1 Tax=Davidia involucrata TaxID=16924 RepID=A0A5B7AKV2_DAVIN